MRCSEQQEARGTKRNSDPETKRDSDSEEHIQKHTTKQRIQETTSQFQRHNTHDTTTKHGQFQKEAEAPLIRQNKYHCRLSAAPFKGNFALSFLLSFTSFNTYPFHLTAFDYYHHHDHSNHATSTQPLRPDASQECGQHRARLLLGVHPHQRIFLQRRASCFRPQCTSSNCWGGVTQHEYR